MLNLLDEIKARCDKATPGPWITGDGSKITHYNGKDTVLTNSSTYVVTNRATYPDDKYFNDQVYANMDFIAHSREDIPTLIAEVERLTAENAKLREESAKDYNDMRRFQSEHIKLSQENAALQSERDEEKSRRYQAECNYDHAVKDCDELREALKQVIKKLIFPYGCADDDKSNRIIDNFMEQYIQQAKENLQK
jgi:hypothetical protein